MDVKLRAHVEEPLPELPRPEKLLVIASLAGPTVWLTQLTVAFSLVGPLCQAQLRWPMHLVTLAALVVVVAATAYCWRRRETPGAPHRRIAASGVALGAFFAVLVLALELPTLLLHPCT
jgi:hypothetical protein